MTAVIELVGAGKRYWKLQEQAMLLKSLLPGMGAKKSEFWALRDVNFTIEPGETVGIIGRNGAGKTTLLRMLAGVSRPSEGVVRVRGRVAPLLSVGVGFHHEMSGRENVLVNGMLLGLSKQQVAKRFDEIVAFAELEELIDTPVKFYSSGQYLRLGFAVAVHVDPDVLLVDEVLAVGDLAFQMKCLDRMRALQAVGTTILFVSHFIHAIRVLCPRAILFREGHLECDASAEVSIARYHENLTLDQNAGEPGLLNAGVGPVTALASAVVRSDGEETHHPERGELLRYRATLRCNRALDSPHLQFRVTSLEGVLCYAMQTEPDREWRKFNPGDTIDVDVPFVAQLAGGSYRLSVAVAERNVAEWLTGDLGEVAIYLAPQVGSMGFANLDATIIAEGQELSEHGDVLLARPGQQPESSAGVTP